MHQHYCFEITLTNGDVEFYNVADTSRERAFMHAVLAYGTWAKTITLTVVMEPA